MTEIRPHLCFKIAFLGDANVGKSSIISTLIDPDSAKQPKSSVGVVVTDSPFMLNKLSLCVSLWDVPGGMLFRGMVGSSTAAAAGLAFVFSGFRFAVIFS